MPKLTHQLLKIFVRTRVHVYLQEPGWQGINCEQNASKDAGHIGAHLRNRITSIRHGEEDAALDLLVSMYMCMNI